MPNDRYGYGIASPSKALAPNPAVDNGPKDNPLLTRVESQGAPDSSSPAPVPQATGGSHGGSTLWLYGAGGGVLVLIVLGVTFLIRRANRRPAAAAPAAPNGVPAPGAYPPPYPPQQPHQAPYPPQHHDPRS